MHNFPSLDKMKQMDIFLSIVLTSQIAGHNLKNGFSMPEIRTPREILKFEEDEN